jgi:hypothetical protein
VTHRPSEQIRFGQAEAGQLVGDAQDLFLVQDDAKSFFQQWSQSRMQMLHRFFAFETPHESIFQTTSERTGTVQGQGGHDVVFAAGMDLAQRGAHAGTFDLEAADGPPVLDQVGGLGIV